MPITDSKQFEGAVGGSKLCGVSLFRADSMDVKNDPRLFANNVIMKRMGAFHLIAVSAVLMGCLSCKMMMTMENKQFEDIFHYITFMVLAFCFITDLFAVIVLIQQLYHVTRLVTAGNSGFEIAQSYYLNPNVVSLRQFSVRLYFGSIPLFLGAVSYSVVVKLGTSTSGRLHAAPVAIIMFTVAMGLWYIINKHRHIFLERYAAAKAHETPLLGHLNTLETNMGFDI